MGLPKTIDLTRDGDFGKHQINRLSVKKDNCKVIDFDSLNNSHDDLSIMSPWHDEYYEYDALIVNNRINWDRLRDEEVLYRYTCDCCGRPIERTPWDNYYKCICVDCHDDDKPFDWNDINNIIDINFLYRLFIDNESAVTSYRELKMAIKSLMHITT